jgi:hypothetical protein
MKKRPDDPSLSVSSCLYPFLPSPPLLLSPSCTTAMLSSADASILRSTSASTQNAPSSPIPSLRLLDHSTRSRTERDHQPSLKVATVGWKCETSANAMMLPVLVISMNVNSFSLLSPHHFISFFQSQLLLTLVMCIRNIIDCKAATLSNNPTSPTMMNECSTQTHNPRML